MAAILGHEAARIFTPPLRELTPDTTHGYRVIAFAEQMLGVTLDPWQKWVLIHALELKPDGTYRFRTALLLVARQNGKTTIVQVLFLWALFTGRAQLAVGPAQDLGIARRTWHAAIKMARADDELREQIVAVRKANGQETLELVSGAEYIIQATNEDAGRGLQGVDLLHLDELRTHTNDGAWSALTKTTSARPNSLTICTSNAGSDASVPLNRLHATAIAGTDPTLFLAEYSAPSGCDLDDPEGRAAANPSLGNGRLSAEALDSARALDPEPVFRTECLCQRVPTLVPTWQVVEEAPWVNLADLNSTALDPVTLCVEVAFDRLSASIAFAGSREDSKYHVEVAASRPGTDWLLERLLSMWNHPDHAVTAVVVDDKSPAAPLIKDLQDAGVTVLVPKARDMAAAYARWVDGAKADVIRHRSQPELNDAMAAVTTRSMGDQTTWERENAVSVHPVVACSLALWGHLSGGSAKFFVAFGD